jgi:hypothetical protein
MPAEQDLERRRTHDDSTLSSSVTPDAWIAGRESLDVDEDMRTRIAIYLIEREAIELRRKKWAEQIPVSSAPSILSGWAESSEEHEERLRKYDKPSPSSKASRSGSIRRLRSSVMSFFRKQ